MINNNIITDVYNNVIQNQENLNNINISNIEGPTFNESILEGSTYNEFLSTINFKNLNSDIVNLYNEINKTNENIANADFTINENNSIFDETIINSLTTKLINKENTEILEVREIINNLHEKITETHHEIQVLKDEKKEKPNVQKISTNLQKPEMKSDINLNLNSNGITDIETKTTKRSSCFLESLKLSGN